MLCIIGRSPSKSVRIISHKAEIPRYVGKRSNKATILVNYGLAGDNLDSFYRRVPSARHIPTINRNIGHSKLSVINRAANRDIKVPESKLSLSRKEKPKEFIEKRTNSVGGIGIKRATGRGQIPGKYYQRFIDDRLYEIRVHAFTWMDEWPVQKRVGSKDEIAWNFKQGGRFLTVRNPDRYGVFTKAREVSKEILEMLNMSFGAVDFIVDKNYEVIFIEINSAPGFGDLSEPFYVEAFQELKSLSNRELKKLAR